MYAVKFAISLQIPPHCATINMQAAVPLQNLIIGFLQDIEHEEMGLYKDTKSIKLLLLFLWMVIVSTYPS